MRSIRGKLIIGVVPGVVVLISALSATLYIYMFNVLTEQQDSSLYNRARVVIGRAHWSGDDPSRIISPDAAYGEFGRDNHPSCFEIFGYDGTPLLRSKWLGTTDLPIPEMKDDGPVYSNVKFPNGRSGRAISFRFAPATKAGEKLFSGNEKGLAAGKKLTIILAKDASPVRDPLLVLLSSLAALVGIMAGGIILLMSLALKRGLKPLELIARQAATRSPDDAPDLFPIDGMPGELQPICERLNDLLGRLYNALQRQRRFTTDAAHELRTPIAEIRSVAEVSVKWGDLDAARGSLVDVLEVTRKMETIVTHLLAIARCDFSKQAMNFQSVEINPLIEKAWENFTPRARERGINMQMQLAAELTVQSDPTLLESILVNLLSNAVDYATTGSTLSCVTRMTEKRLHLEIANHVDGLSAEDVTHVFEPFWRKDASRSDDRHCGLGLTLTKAYADAINARVGVELREENRICFSLQFPPGATEAARKLPAGATAEDRLIPRQRDE